MIRNKRAPGKNIIYEVNEVEEDDEKFVGLERPKKPTKWVKIDTENNWESITYVTSDGFRFTAMEPKKKFWFRAKDGTEFQAVPMQDFESTSYMDCGHRYEVKNNIITVPVQVMGTTVKIPLTELEVKL